jgi:hypothetical protein
MFRASADLATLAIQLAYFRGLGELHFEEWQSDAETLARRMSGVHCAAGRTQIARLLKAALERQATAKVQALVFIGDAMEESAATLESLAGKCRLLGLPLFIFQEGNDPTAQRCFRAMAQISGGAYEFFDQGSAQRLRDLLGAVARYAAGGKAALENQNTAGARRLLEQLSR